ncbi:MAG TPA: hypothetical protein VHZ95_21655, partial [Polyangiales bacterium]|nr:hypothetical protein [Polyangiales bacterium]
MVAIKQYGGSLALVAFWLSSCASEHSLANGMSGSADQASGQASAMQVAVDAGASFIGASAHVDLEPIAGASPSLEGSGTLIQRDASTDLTIDVFGCDKAMNYAVFIQSG